MGVPPTFFLRVMQVVGSAFTLIWARGCVWDVWGSNISLLGVMWMGNQLNQAHSPRNELRRTASATGQIGALAKADTRRSSHVVGSPPVT